jgi:predicted dehydrogenase
VEIYGTKGTFLNGTDEAEFWDSTEKGAQPTKVNTPYRDYQKPDLIHSFVDACLGRGKPMVNFEDVERATRVCFAIEQSVNQGMPVKPLKTI